MHAPALLRFRLGSKILHAPQARPTRLAPPAVASPVSCAVDRPHPSAIAPPRVPDDPASRAERIDVERERGVTVVFGDGRSCTFALEELRVNCPCAACRGLRDRGMAAWPTAGAPDVLRIEGADLVGSWGLALRWNDGHTTGIYPWEALRSWCEDRSP